jgi:surfeit locus 1 family protein
MIAFRPLPVLTLAAVPLLALLLALGIWQVQRAGWKAELVAELERRAATPPAPLGEALCRDDPSGPVTVDLILGPDPIRIYGAGPDGRPGWLIVQPAYGPQCAPGDHELDRRVLVQTGFEAITGEFRAAPPALSLEPWPESGAFTPENAPERGEYYRFDAALAEAAGVPPEALVPVWARWDDRPALGRVSIMPAEHIGYALTWFGLAIALAAFYLAMHVQAGRLRLGRQR